MITGRLPANLAGGVVRKPEISRPSKLGQRTIVCSANDAGFAPGGANGVVQRCSAPLPDRSRRPSPGCGCRRGSLPAAAGADGTASSPGCRREGAASAADRRCRHRRSAAPAGLRRWRRRRADDRSASSVILSMSHGMVRATRCCAPSARRKNISSRNSPARSPMKKKPEPSRFQTSATWLAGACVGAGSTRLRDAVANRAATPPTPRPKVAGERDLRIVPGDRAHRPAAAGQLGETSLRLRLERIEQRQRLGDLAAAAARGGAIERQREVEQATQRCSHSCMLWRWPGSVRSVVCRVARSSR